MISAFQNLLQHRALLRALTLREVRARYRGSVLGFIWSFLNPLLLLIIYTVVFRYLFIPAKAGTGPEPFGAFLFTGILAWTWFSGALLESCWSIVHGGGLLKKVVFPAEILPLVPVLSNAIHFLVGLPVLIVVLMLLGHTLSLNALAMIPVFFIQLTLTAGLALVFAALSVLFRDVPQLVGHLVTFGFFAAPIIYVVNAVPEFIRPLIVINPITHIILGWQNALFFDRPPELFALGVTAVISIAVAMGGYAMFDRLRDVLSEEV